jgi:hypothetical protein
VSSRTVPQIQPRSFVNINCFVAKIFHDCIALWPIQHADVRQNQAERQVNANAVAQAELCDFLGF